MFALSTSSITLKTLLRILKNKLKIGQSSGIFEINCNNCDQKGINYHPIQRTYYPFKIGIKDLKN